MEIIKTRNGDELTIALVGRLDTLTSPELEKVLKEELGDVKALVYDFKDLIYISSAGLRMLLLSQKMMNEKGSMVIRNAQKEVMDVFELTGFNNVLTIE